MLGANAGRALSFEQARAGVHELLQSPEWSGKWLAVLDDLPAPSPAEMEGAGLGWLLGEFPWRHGRTIITTRAAAWEQEEEDSREVSAAEQRRCDQCGRGGLSGAMQKCGKCRLVYYCSVDCQTAAWGEHKGVCAPRRSVADVTGLSVESFGDEEACSWIQSTVRQWRGDDAGVLELVQYLGCLPLAVGVASAFASTHKTATAGEYLAELKRAAPKAARKGVVCMTAGPRYAGREDERSGRDVLLDAGRLRKVLEAMIALEESEMTVWLTTKEMGYALEAESDELIEERDEREGRRTGRWIAPQIESFIRGIENGPRTTADGEDQGDATLQEELRIMLADWCSPNEKGKPKEGERVRQLVMRWESESEPLMAKEPRVLEDVDVELEIGEGWFFNQAVPRHCSGKGYVRVMSEPVKWTEEGLGMQILNVEGRVASLDPKHPWTITSAQWNSLKAKTGTGQGGDAQGRDLVERLYEESQVQERLERQGVRCMTWRVLRSLQAVFEATTLQGGTMVTAAPFFDAARRGKAGFWGRGEGPEVVLWDTLDEQEKAEWKETNGNRKDYIIVRKARGRARQQEVPNSKTKRQVERRHDAGGNEQWSGLVEERRCTSDVK